MMLAPGRLLGAWFALDSYGINAIAQAQPRQTIGGGTDDAPPSVTVLHGPDDKSFSDSGTPSVLPAYVLWGVKTTLVGRTSRLTTRDVELGAGLFTKDGANQAKWIGAFDAIARAVESSLLRYNSATKSADYRDLNGVHVEYANLLGVQQITMAGEGDTPVMWGIMKLEARIVYATQ